MGERKKIAIVGAGRVGRTTAEYLAKTGTADIALVDINADTAAIAAFDLANGSAAPQITGGADFSLAAGASAVVLATGTNPEPGDTHETFARRNAEIVGWALAGLAETAKEAVIIVVTSPPDEMTHFVQKKLAREKGAIIDMSSALANARFAAYLANEIGTGIDAVEAASLGGHGDTFVPLPRLSRADGEPVEGLLNEEAISLAAEKARDAAKRIFAATGGFPYLSGAAVTAELARAIVVNEKRTMNCGVLLGGEYGIDGTFFGVPCVVGASGAEKIIEYDLADDESNRLKEAVDLTSAYIRSFESARERSP